METENTKFKVIESELNNILKIGDDTFDITSLINSDLSSPEKSVVVWERIGLLGGLTDQNKINIISVAMSICAKYLLITNFGENENVRGRLELLLFPIVRRILQQENAILTYNYDKILDFVMALIPDLIENIKTFDFDFKKFNIDAEAEFCSVYSQNFNVKKYFE